MVVVVVVVCVCVWGGGGHKLFCHLSGRLEGVIQIFEA